MQGFKVKLGQRVFNSEGLGPMGFGIPAAIGAFMASGKKVVSVDGDGGFMMNIQELGTIALHRMPIKIFVLNNNGYGSIKTTQDSYFDGRRLGTDSKSGSKVLNGTNLSDELKKVINSDGPHVCEVIVDPEQIIEPKVKTIRAKDGKLVTSEPSELFP
jgi:acetolactate synthase-1/2/3 large subunit